MTKFTPEHIQKCKDAMKKSEPLKLLKLISTNNIIVELSDDRRSIRIHGYEVAGGWPLFASGAIDQFGMITDKGREYLRLTPVT